MMTHILYLGSKKAQKNKKKTSLLKETGENVYLHKALLKAH